MALIAAMSIGEAQSIKIKQLGYNLPNHSKIFKQL
jgi:hypothetical protein